jgi:putative nucleotidyltransferase with HDIG domain
MDDCGFENILFVDDEECILSVSAEYFKRKGYQVLTARDGLEALEVLNSQPVDCCFTDINMPGMDGLALAEHIREMDNTLPVIIMTGYPSLENTIRTLKNGVVDFLIKPVNLNQMELCVRRVFNQRRLFAENILLKKEVDGKARLEALNRELTLKIEELNVLNRILVDFSVNSSSEDVFRRLVNTAVEVTRSDSAGFYVVNDTVGHPVAVAAASSAGSGGESSDVSPAEAKEIERLIADIVTDEIPLLVSGESGGEGVCVSHAPMMIVPLRIRKTIFGVLTAGRRPSSPSYTEKDLYYLSFMAQNAANAIENMALYENIYENLFATLYAFVNAIEARDRYTRQHSSRVTSFSILIGKALGCSSEELEILNFAGHLHDIGKIGIRDDILLKPGRLTAEEFEKIKEHPVIGANIVAQLGFWEREREIIRCHHERFDGTGYPDGLKGPDIPFLARLLSVADVYDAISSDRAYRRRMEEDQVLAIIRDGAGSQFDPAIVEVFLQMHRQGCFAQAQTAEVAVNPFSELKN